LRRAGFVPAGWNPDPMQDVDSATWPWSRGLYQRSKPVARWNTIQRSARWATFKNRDAFERAGSTPAIWSRSCPWIGHAFTTPPTRSDDRPLDRVVRPPVRGVALAVGDGPRVHLHGLPDDQLRAGSRPDVLRALTRRAPPPRARLPARRRSIHPIQDLFRRSGRSVSVADNRDLAARKRSRYEPTHERADGRSRVGRGRRHAAGLEPPRSARNLEVAEARRN